MKKINIETRQRKPASKVKNCVQNMKKDSFCVQKPSPEEKLALKNIYYLFKTGTKRPAKIDNTDRIDNTVICSCLSIHYTEIQRKC